MIHPGGKLLSQPSVGDGDVFQSLSLCFTTFTFPCAFTAFQYCKLTVIWAQILLTDLMGVDVELRTRDSVFGARPGQINTPASLLSPSSSPPPPPSHCSLTVPPHCSLPHCSLPLFPHCSLTVPSHCSPTVPSRCSLTVPSPAPTVPSHCSLTVPPHCPLALFPRCSTVPPLFPHCSLPRSHCSLPLFPVLSSLLLSSAK